MNMPLSQSSTFSLPEQKLLILVVEDNLVFSRAVKQSLEGHQIVSAQTAEDALELYQEHLPDITLLDIELPDGNGLDVLRAIMEYDPEGFVVMLTGSRIAQNVQAAIKSSAKGYIVKPFSRGKLQNYIELYIRQRDEIMDRLAKRKLQYGAHAMEPIAKKLTLPPEAGKGKNVEKQSAKKAKDRQKAKAILQEMEDAPSEMAHDAAPSEYYEGMLRESLNLLFIDHMTDNLRRVQEALSKYGYNVDTAITAEEATRLMQEKEYELVILDCDLPEIDSYFFANRIRQMDRVASKHRFIVGLGKTSKADLNDRWRIAGMNAYIKKPLPVQKIHAFIQKHLEEFFAPYTNT